MKHRYILKTKNDETVSTTSQESLESAIEFFSFLKNFTTSELLSIYKVEKDENRNNY